MRLAQIVFFFLLIPLSNSWAQKIWNATSSPAYWNDPANWVGGVPGATDAVIFNNTSSVNCELNVSPSIASLSVNGFTGTIDLHGFNLLINSAAVVTNTFATGTFINLSTVATLSIDAITSQATFSGSTFQSGVNVTVRIGDLYLNGSTFGGTSSFTKYARTINTCLGGNVFNGPTIIGLNNDTGLQLNLTGSSPDVFNSTIQFIGASSSSLRIGYGAQCTLNGNVTLSNPSGLDNLAFGIFFGNGSTTGGISILTSGTMSTSTPFNGVLQFENFTQTGSGAINLSMSASTARLVVYASTFKGNFSADARRLELTSSTFGGSTNSFTSKTTVALVHSATSQCTFGTAGVPGTTTFDKSTNNNSNFQIENSGGVGTYYNNLIIRYSGGGATPRVVFGGFSNCYADVSWNNTSTTAIGLGSVWFSGSADQTVSAVAGQATFFSVTMQKTGTGKVNLNTPLICNGDIKFNNGIISSSVNTNYVQLNSWSGTPTNASHVDAPVQKVGNTAFTFPTGNLGMYGPMQITAPSSASTFQARFARSSPRSLDPDRGAGLVTVSDCEYWTLDRTVGTGSVDVSLSWGLPSSSNCIITNTSELRVAQYDGSQWIDKGNNVAFLSGNNSSGSIRSGTGMVTSFSPNMFALASSTANNPLPVELLSFDGHAEDAGVLLTWATATELNNDRFELEHSSSGLDFTTITSIQEKKIGSLGASYEYFDRRAVPGNNYYRLKQVDINGTTHVLKVINVMQKNYMALTIYPNPATNSDMISLSKKGNFTLVNSLGKVVIRLEQTDELDTSALKPGTYALISDDGNFVRLIIK